MESVYDCVNGGILFEGDNYSWGLVGDIGRWIKEAEVQPRWKVFNLICSTVGGIISAELEDLVEMFQASD